MKEFEVIARGEMAPVKTVHESNVNGRRSLAQHYELINTYTYTSRTYSVVVVEGIVFIIHKVRETESFQGRIESYKRVLKFPRRI